MGPSQYPISSRIECPESVDFSQVAGKSVIVTGGSSGLGAAYVKAFSDNGAFVTNADIKPPEEDSGASKVVFVKCDVRNWQDQVNVFKTAIAKSPRHGIDIVVANAGVSGSDEFYEENDDGDDEPRQPQLRILEINLLSFVYTAKLSMHYMKRQPDQSFDRCLILKSSIMGYLDTNGSPTYGSAKHGVRGLMKCLRRRAGLRVNVVAPWYIATPLMSKAVMERLTSQLMEQGSGFGRIEDCVKAVMRIATDSTVNGRSIAVLPRETVPAGYLDVDLDDFEPGGLYDKLQTICSNLTHRQLPPQAQR